MIYTYSINRWTDDRTISADNTPLKAQFEAVVFTDEDLNIPLADLFSISRMDTLMLLFTGVDLLSLLGDESPACNHDEEEECDCPSPSVRIPSVLAYHTSNLRTELDDALEPFTEWKTSDGKQIHRQYRTPDGEMHTIQRDTGPVGIFRPEWEAYDYWKSKETDRVVQRWFQQGIALYNACKEN